MELQPYKVEVPQEVLDDLKRRLRHTRWPDALHLVYSKADNVSYLSLASIGVHPQVFVDEFVREFRDACHDGVAIPSCSKESFVPGYYWTHEIGVQPFWIRVRSSRPYSIDCKFVQPKLNQECFTVGQNLYNYRQKRAAFNGLPIVE